MNKPNIKIDCEYRAMKLEVINKHDAEVYVCNYQGKCNYKVLNPFWRCQECHLSELERNINRMAFK